jgi:hypothetical protein
MKLFVENWRKFRKRVLNEGGFSRIRQIMLGQVPSVDTVGILTAENPAGQPASPQVNAALMKDLKDSLKLMRTGYTHIGGSFGAPESSVLIMNISRDDVVSLGEKFGQEAVIWGQKNRDDNGEPFYRFEYIEGSVTVQTRDVSLSSQSVQSLDDFYSEKEGRKFVIPFFDEEYESASQSAADQRLSFEPEELPDDEETRELTESIKKRSARLLDKKRTLKSRWHHRNIMREEMKRLEKLIRP